MGCERRTLVIVRLDDHGIWSEYPEGPGMHPAVKLSRAFDRVQESLPGI